MRKGFRGCACVVPAPNSLQLPPAKIEAIFDCFRGISRLSIGGNCIAVRGNCMDSKTISHYKIIESDHSSQAVVVGASVAGLFAARALADFFARVVVIERENLDTRWSTKGRTTRRSHSRNFASDSRSLAAVNARADGATGL